jgi:predicted nucleic acid-binding protein
VSELVRGVLDTSVLIDPGTEPLPGVLAISTISLAELQFGVLVTTSPEVRANRLRRLSLISRRFDALPVDEAVADSYGQLAVAVVRAGRQPWSRTADLLIAATAHAHGATLYTRNAADFGGLEDLLQVHAI